MAYNINFTKKVFVSVSEKNKNKKFEIGAFGALLFSFLTVAIALVLNIFVSTELNRVQAVEQDDCCGETQHQCQFRSIQHPGR
jgi:hypothetical protein